MERSKKYHLTNARNGDKLTAYQRDDYLVIVDTQLSNTFEGWVKTGWTLWVDHADIDRVDGEQTLSREAIDLIRAGQKIPAIKQVRIDTGLGLGEAKKVVEDWMKDNI